MAKPKQASDQDQKPELIIEDSVEPIKEPAKPVKTDTITVNGIEMTYEDY